MIIFPLAFGYWATPLTTPGSGRPGTGAYARARPAGARQARPSMASGHSAPRRLGSGRGVRREAPSGRGRGNSSTPLDETLTLQAMLDALTAGATLTLEARTYYYAGPLTRHNMSDLTIDGNGATLKCTSISGSALRMHYCPNLTIRDLAIVGMATERTSFDADDGLDLWDVDNLLIEAVSVHGVGCAGIIVYADGSQSSVGTIRNCEIRNSGGDGIQLAGVNNFTIEDCQGYNTGDDSFSSIGYDQPWNPGPNANVTIQRCRSYSSGASGVAIEGNTDALVQDCYIEASAVAGIRVQSTVAYATYPCDGVTVDGNTLVRCKTDPSVGHASIEIAANDNDLLNIVVSDNDINEPQGALGALHEAETNGYIADVTYDNNRLNGVVI